MTDGESKKGGAGIGRGLGCFMALVLGGAMIALVVVLARGHESGQKAIDAYVTSIKLGQPVSASVGGREADALTAALRASKSISVGNFQSQSSTSCFWVTLHGDGADVDARFVLAESASKVEVTGASLARECDCPDDAKEPCHLE